MAAKSLDSRDLVVSPTTCKDDMNSSLGRLYWLAKPNISRADRIWRPQLIRHPMLLIPLQEATAFRIVRSLGLCVQGTDCDVISGNVSDLRLPSWAYFAACMSVSQSYGSPLLLTLGHLVWECVNVEGDSYLLHLSRTVSPLYMSSGMNLASKTLDEVLKTAPHLILHQPSHYPTYRPYTIVPRQAVGLSCNNRILPYQRYA
jgi:hypothetical protein